MSHLEREPLQRWFPFRSKRMFVARMQLPSIMPHPLLLSEALHGRVQGRCEWVSTLRMRATRTQTLPNGIAPV